MQSFETKYIRLS